MRKVILLLLVLVLCPVLHSQAMPVSGKGPDTSTGMVTTAELKGIILDNDTGKPIKVGWGGKTELTLVHLELLTGFSATEWLKNKPPKGNVVFESGDWRLLITPVKKKGKWGGGGVFTWADKDTGEFRFTGMEDGHYALLLTGWMSGQWMDIVHKDKLTAAEPARVVLIDIQNGQSVNIGTVYATNGKIREFRGSEYSGPAAYIRCKDKCSFFEAKKDAATGTVDLYVVETQK